MKFKDKLKGPWSLKKTFAAVLILILIPLIVYGANTGLRIFRLYDNVHEPIEDESAESSSPGAPEDPDDENSEGESSVGSRTDEHAPVEDFSASQDANSDLDLVPIEGETALDFQEIDHPFYEAATSEDVPHHLNILLLGLDENLDEPGRSDSIMVARLNTETEEAAILSIPRDTYLYIPGSGYSKAGHMTAYGDTSLAVQTIEGFLDISIDYFIRVDMSGFENSVDALGGVTVDIPEDLVHENDNVLFEAGEKHMDGEDVLDYTRARKLKEGSGGDLGRISRQQQVLFEMLRKLRSELTMNETLDFMEEITPYIRTNIGPAFVIEHWSDFQDLDLEAMDLRTLSGISFTHDNLFYFRVPVENARIIIDHMAN